jgi:hypothetical protein
MYICNRPDIGVLQVTCIAEAAVAGCTAGKVAALVGRSCRTQICHSFTKNIHRASKKCKFALSIKHKL